MEGKIWILHVAGQMSVGGVQSVLMSYYKNIDREKFRFAFAVQRDFPMEYDKEIEALGGRVHFLQKLGTRKGSFESALFDLIKQHPEYRIVHAHFNHMNWRILKVAKEAGVKVRISHAHAAVKSLPLHTKVHTMYWSILLRYYATHLIACSKASGKYLHLTDESELAMNAFNLERFRYNAEMREVKRKELGVTGSIVIGQIGHIDRVKNQLFSLKVLQQLDDKYKLVLVGGRLGGNYCDNVQDYIKEHNLTDRVIMTGVRTDVSDLLNAFDLMAFPSLHEGLSVVCVEAQVNGIEIISSDQVPDEANVAGLMTYLPIGEDHITDWAKAIKSASLKREDRVQRIVDAGYEIQSAAKKLEHLYTEWSR